MLYILEKIKYLAGLEKKLAARLKESSLTFLRISLGLVFTWFGLLKFFPGISPAEEIATSTIALLTHGFITPLVSLKILAAWEVLIGLGFLHGKYIRVDSLTVFPANDGSHGAPFHSSIRSLFPAALGSNAGRSIHYQKRSPYRLRSGYLGKPPELRSEMFEGRS